MSRSPQSTVDFVAFGVVAVRLEAASARQVAGVAAVLGPPAPAGGPEADIHVRFVDRLPTSGVRWVVPGRVGASAEGFTLALGTKRRAGALIPMDRVGASYAVACDARARRVPFLDVLVRLAALSKGYATVHASAFEWRGAGILVAGSAHGGKTSAALAFAPGATFLSDDLVLLDPDGRRMLGVPAPVEVGHWQLAQLEVPGGKLLGMLGRIAPHPLRRRIKRALPPEALFRRTASECRGPDALFLASVRDDPRIVARATQVAPTLERLAVAFQRDILPLLDLYHAHLLVFPDRTNPLLDRAGELNRLLLQRLRGTRTFDVVHPRPVDLAALGRAMRSSLEAPEPQGSGRGPVRARQTGSTRSAVEPGR